MLGFGPAQRFRCTQCTRRNTCDVKSDDVSSLKVHIDSKADKAVKESGHEWCSRSWRSSSSSLTPVFESADSIAISDSASNNKTMRLRQLRKTLGDKLSSVSNTMLRKMSWSRPDLHPSKQIANYEDDNVKVLQETVVAMQHCVKSLEDLESRIKEVLGEASKGNDLNLSNLASMSNICEYAIGTAEPHRYSELKEDETSSCKMRDGPVKGKRWKKQPTEQFFVTKAELYHICFVLALEAKAAEKKKSKKPKTTGKDGLSGRLAGGSLVECRLDRNPNRKRSDSTLRPETGTMTEDSRTPKGKGLGESRIDSNTSRLGVGRNCFGRKRNIIYKPHKNKSVLDLDKKIFTALSLFSTLKRRRAKKRTTQ